MSDEPEPQQPPPQPDRVLRAVWPWILVVAIAMGIVLGCIAYFHVKVGVLTHELHRAITLAFHPDSQEGELVEWKSPKALVLVVGAALVGVLAFHLHKRRSAVMGFSQVALVRKRGWKSWLADLPAALRVVAIMALAIGLSRPETYRVVKHDVDSIDIMVVVDMSKSMEETDMQRDRLDAAQRVIRRFIHKSHNDRIGLVVFGQQAMLQCPLTQDMKLLEQIVSDLAIGDVPELGTAIGDGLALALAQLRRSDAKSKVVILLSDGDTNWVTRFDPDQAAKAAKDMGVKVYTLLVGSEQADLFGGMSVNPDTLRNIAATTGGEFFRAADYESFDHGFQTVRKKLDTTKRTITERIPDRQLFVPLAVLAAILLLVELILSNTWLRRFP
ncbi:MAG: VWA domain-containing protein [Kofleriaceae bacterium]